MMKKHQKLYIVLLLMTYVTVGCAAAPQIMLTSATPPAEDTAMIVYRTLQPIPQITVTENQSVACAPFEESLIHVRYTVSADIDFASFEAHVQQNIRFINTTGSELSQIMFYIEPNHWQNVFALNRVVSSGTSLSYELIEQRLIVDLPEPLLPDCQITIGLDYNLDIPYIGSDITASKGYFGRTERQLNLGHWLATIPPYQNNEWVIQEYSIIGEQNILEEADWNVTINLISSPENLVIAAPGVATQISGTSWRYEHHASRDFTVSLSDQFNVTSAATSDDVMVEVYSLANHANPEQAGQAAAHALDVATRSLTLYNALFGDYPYTRMVVVQGDFPDGMEFSGLVFVGNGWFINYVGDPASYLTLITAHEVAHQWWYAQVGNNSALYPWLDEAFATYSEYLFMEAIYPDLSQWWWRFRVNNYGPVGFVDSTVYEFSSVREYINAIYLRGVLMLQEIREDIGTDAFYDLLSNYVEVNAGNIVTPASFWSLLTPEQQAQTAETRSRYLRHPDN